MTATNMYSNFGGFRCSPPVLVQNVVRLLFRLRTGLAGLLMDKKRCKMIIEERCVICECGAGEDV